MYYFVVSFLAAGGSTHLLLLKDNHEVARGFGKTHDATESIVWTVQLKRGDVVRISEITGQGYERILEDGWSSFTGFKLNWTVFELESQK